jgi:hypothetical protein
MLPETKGIIKLGLVQIPTEGLERLAQWIKEGKPILLDGGIYDYVSGIA